MPRSEVPRSLLVMPRPRDIAFCLALAVTGITTAYVLNEWVLPWWDARHPPRVPPESPDDKKSPSSSSQQDRQPSIRVDPPAEVPPPVTDPGANRGPHPPLTSESRSLPPLRTYALPPPLPNGRAIFAINPDAMTSSTSLHTLSTQDGTDEDGASQPNTSDTDAEPFVDVLSPPPTHVVTRRRSLRNHDLFAASHISFSELGSLVAPEDESH